MHDDVPPVRGRGSGPTDETENTFLQPRRGPRRWPVLLILAATILVPGMFWRQVWWGARLSDDELHARLSRPDNVRRVQHALEEISKRVQEDPETARPFYPLVIALSDNREPLIRSAAAWLMGEDNGHEPFKEPLRRLLADPEPVVRYNAATALTCFADASGRPVLRNMLRPYAVRAEWDGAAAGGTVKDVLREGDPVNPRSQLALLELDGGGESVILAPLGGRLADVHVSEGRRVRRGDELASIAPNAEQVWAALRALCLVGRADHLEDVERYVDAPSRFPPRIAQQARATAAAIRRREGAG